ncbi:N-glycosylation protein-domain-containing protein [Lipomyces chichibuensis]|uniref:N-glycosylation protein-domain-containing protein n=1 Tax=Lipomyces chichibuensis TaxID=1546026 RepID=UPI0033441747
MPSSFTSSSENGNGGYDGNAYNYNYMTSNSYANEGGRRGVQHGERIHCDDSGYLYRRRNVLLDEETTTDEDDTEGEMTGDEYADMELQQEQFRRLLQQQQNRILNEQSANLIAAMASRLVPSVRQNMMPPVPDYRPPGGPVAFGETINSSVMTQTPSIHSNVNSYPSSSRASPKPVVSERNLKDLIRPGQNFTHMICKALSLPPSIHGIYGCLYEAWKVTNAPNGPARSLELVLAALWAGVSAYLFYAFIDGLMLRWLVMYSSPATILRLLSINTLMAAMTRLVLTTFADDPVNLLPTWILIACILTAAYAIQNFVTSNIAIEERARRVDIYHIAVFAVVPVGIASFITMLGLIRSLMVIRSGNI